MACCRTCWRPGAEPIVYWIGFPLSIALALALVPAGARGLAEAGLVRENYRGAWLAFPLGAVLATAALVALAPLAFLNDRADLELLDPELRRWIPYVIGVAFLGFLDDSLGGGEAGGAPRGWRGHARALSEGRLSTGAIKAIGAVALAAYVVSGQGLESWHYLADVALLILTTNLFNLLDLRPGRAEKGLVLMGAGLCLGAWTLAPVELLGIFAGPVLIGAWLTLRERAMLGDTGSNLVGAIAGVWLLTTLDGTGRLITLGVVVVITIYGEMRSLSATIESVPPLRWLDSLGRG
jgi:UDP-GlcNAc:undecaprenyl-phosphate/decaprenyl-phosphate GlcNAc-1-phosphate transferase